MGHGHAGSLTAGEAAANSPGAIARFPQEQEVPMSLQPGDAGDSRPRPALPTPAAMEARWLLGTPVAGFLLRA